MTLTVTHTKVSAIADDANAAAKGEVLPSDWNANHTVTGVAFEEAGGNLTFYVSTTGSDSNAGTLANPFRTIGHALAEVAGYDYQNLYFPTIIVADGTYAEEVTLPSLIGVVEQLFLPGNGNELLAAGNLIGNITTPTNCVIRPSTSVVTAVLTTSSFANWSVQGFSLRAAIDNGSVFVLNVTSDSTVYCGPIDLDVGTTPELTVLMFCRIGSVILQLDNWTFRSSGAGTVDYLFRARDFSFITTLNGSLTATTAITANVGVFTADVFGSLGFIGGTGWVNPANITGPTFALTNQSSFQFGVDPITNASQFPGNSFGTLDLTSSIDGFLYGEQIAGSPVDGTNIYRDSFLINKDTTNGPRYVSYDDGGMIHVRQIGRNINTQTSTNYTLQLFDQDGRVEMNNAGANTVTVPSSSTVNFPLGTEIKIVQVGAGATTPSTGAGATIHAVAAIGGQWKSATLYKRGADEWVQTNV